MSKWSSLPPSPSAVLAEKLFRDGMWFRKPYVLLSVLSSSESDMLAYLYSVSVMLRTAETAGGWFYHTWRQIEERMFFPRWKTEELIRSLKSKDYIDTKVAGMPGKRHFRINEDKLLILIGEETTAVGTARHQPDVTARHQPDVTARHQPDVTARQHNRKKGIEKTNDKKRGERGRNSTPFKLKTTPSANGHMTKSPDQEDRAALKQLREAMRSNGRVFRPTGGTEPFRLLREEDGQDYHAVLDWYCAHCSREEQQRLDLTDIASPADFRRKYTWIEGKMLREGRKKSPPRPEEVEITPEAKAITALLLKELAWPSAARSNLPAAVQESWTNHVRIADKVRDLTKDPRPRLAGFCKHLTEFGFCHKKHFVEMFFRQVFRRVSGWDSWSGSFKQNTISLDCKHYLKEIEDYSVEWCSSATLSDMLLEELRT